MVEYYWEHHSTYRGIEIVVLMPGSLAYGAMLGGYLRTEIELSDIRTRIDEYLGPEPYWTYHSTYRGIDIQVWMPDGTPFTAYFDGRWVTSASLSALKAAIDDFLEPEPPPGEPYTQVTDFIVPPSLPAGAPIGALTIVAKNTGTGRGYLAVYINSERYTEVAGSSYPTQVDPGGTFTFDLTLLINRNMPNEDFTLTALNDDGTSYIEKTIILLQVGTSTTTTISAPSKAAVDENFFISGILYETESGIPIPSQPINHSYNGRSLGSSTTGVDGDYLKEASIPEAGTWTIKSEFPGTEALQTSRALADAVVGDAPIASPLLIAGSIITGLVLIIYGSM